MYVSEVFESEKGSESHAKRRRVKSDKAVADGKAFFAEVLNVMADEEEEEVLVPDTHEEVVPSANLLSQPGEGGQTEEERNHEPVEEVPDTPCEQQNVSANPEKEEELNQGKGEQSHEEIPDALLQEKSAELEADCELVVVNDPQKKIEKRNSEKKKEEPAPSQEKKESRPRQSWEGLDVSALPPPPPRESEGKGEANTFSLQPDELDDVFSKDVGTEAENVRKLLWEEEEEEEGEREEEVKVVKSVKKPATMLQVGDALRWCVTHGKPHEGLLKVIQGSMVKEVAEEADNSKLFRVALLAFLVTDSCDIPGGLAPLPGWQQQALAANTPKPLYDTFSTLSPTCVRCRLQWAKSLLKTINGTLTNPPANSPFLPPPVCLRSDFHKRHSQHSPECPMHRHRHSK